MKGRIKASEQRRREQVEAVQARLMLAALDLDEVTLRQRQALRRFPALGGVLDPAIERLGEIRREVRKAHQLMAELWNETRRSE